MKKNNHRRQLLIIGPPIVLILVGLAIYILVLKILTPQLDTISAVPNPPQSSTSTQQSTTESSASAKEANPISTTITFPDNATLDQWQEDADKGEDIWRLDPISAAENQAGNYGFIPGDQLTLVTEGAQDSTPQKSATIIATHYGEAYLITIVQPKLVGPKGIWVIKSIEKQS